MMTSADDLASALGPVLQVMHSLQIPHCIGGSVASSYHGASRSTMDVDLLCTLTAETVEDFLDAFNHDDYYMSPAAVREAVHHRSCFNLIHLPTALKIDCFVSEDRPFDRMRLTRSTVVTLGTSIPLSAAMTSAEDVVISKLEWFRKGNESSTRQWDDVSRVMKLLGDNADFPYLREAAESLGLTDLLSRLITEINIPH
jgi:hypothetical protein